MKVVAGVNFDRESLKKADKMAGLLNLSRSQLINRLIQMAQLEPVKTMDVRLSGDGQGGRGVACDDSES